MKNPGKYIREAYMAALTGLTYEGNAIAVYEFLPIETLPDNYVYINSIDYTQVGNNQLFIHTSSITLDVVTRQYKKLDYDTVDGISQEVQDLILTHPFSTLQNADFQFMNPTLESGRYLIEQDSATHYVRNIIRFSQTVIQK
jgi:hypothetical protein